MQTIAAPRSIKISTDGLSMRFNKTPQTILSYPTTPFTFETLPEPLSSQGTGEGNRYYIIWYINMMLLLRYSVTGGLPAVYML